MTTTFFENMADGGNIAFRIFGIIGALVNVVFSVTSVFGTRSWLGIVIGVIISLASGFVAGWLFRALFRWIGSRLGTPDKLG